MIAYLNLLRKRYSLGGDRRKGDRRLGVDRRTGIDVSEASAADYDAAVPVEGSIACITCGAGARSDLEMERAIGVGFGCAGYSKDGEVLWEQDMSMEFDELPTVTDVEKLAVESPSSDWRIYFFAPLYEAEYQRQGNRHWVLVRKGQGFA